jgi:predicted Zn-dependent protease
MTARLGYLTPDFVEKKSGDDLAPKLEEMHDGVYANPEMTAYVTEVGSSMLPYSLRGKEKHTYKILNSEKIINAFTLGNGNIYVTRGLLGMMDNEAELAEVLGHENGHFGNHHIAKQMDRSLGTGLLLAAAESVFLSVKGDKLSDNDQAMIDKVNATVPTLVLNGFGRTQELEADAHGLDTMIPAGYDPGASITLFQRFQKLEPQVNGLQVYMQSHPTAKTRIDDLTSQINGKYPGKIGTGALNQDRYQQIVKGQLGTSGGIGNIAPVVVVGGGLLAVTGIILALTL